MGRPACVEVLVEHRRARQGSLPKVYHLRHPASKADEVAGLLEAIEVHDGAVTTICHVPREICAGLVVPSFVVDGLAQALDLALAVTGKHEKARAG